MADKIKDEPEADAEAAREPEVVSLDAELPDEIESMIEPAGAPDDEPRSEATPPGESPPPVEPPPTEPPPGEPPVGDSVEAEDVEPIRAEEEPIAEGKGSPRLVLAIASGRGGVGKSLLAASVGVYFAQLGKRVVLVDANLGSGNLHTLLGVEEPRVSVHGFLCKDVKHIEEVVAKTPFRGLGLIPGHDNAIGATNPRPAQKNRLINQLRSLAVDYVIIDLAAGSDFNTLDLFLSADLHLVLVMPEPTAVESSFRLIKSAFIRKIRSLKGIDRLLLDLQAGAHCGIPTPNQIYEVARERDPNMGEAIHRAMAEFKPRLVVSMTRTRDDLELGPALVSVGRRHLALPFDYLGYVEAEDVAWVTVRKRRPLLVDYPEAKVAKDIERIARRILSLETKERPECVGVPPPLHLQGHYQILDVQPGATEEEIRRAHRRLRRMYSPESTAIYGVAPPADVGKMHSRIEEAYATLIDPEKRHLYDQRVFPGGAPPPRIDDEVTATPELPRTEPLEASGLPGPREMPLVREDTEFSGALLRQIREARGVELQEIAERTKISIVYLRAIEEENFLATPAPVYLRGFLKTVARDLRLNPEHVARSYMTRYQIPEKD
jgi:flagellar biosynthesis protein FlhG